MKTYYFKNKHKEEIAYNYYTEDEANKEGIAYVPARELEYKGQWALLDDGYVAECIYYFNCNKKPAIFRFANGAFSSKSPLIDSIVRDNRYTLKALGWKENILSKKIERTDPKYLKFVQTYIRTGDLLEAMSHVDNITNRRTYARRDAKVLLQHKEIQEMIKDAVKGALDKHGVSDDWLVGELKKVYESAGTDTSKLRALENFMDITGIKDKKQESTTTEKFFGFNKKDTDLIDGVEVNMIGAAKEEVVVNE